MSHHRIKKVRRVIALAMSVVLVASSVLGALSGCTPRQAYAEDGWEPWGSVLPREIWGLTPTWVSMRRKMEPLRTA